MKNTNGSNNLSLKYKRSAISGCKGKKSFEEKRRIGEEKWFQDR